MTAPVEDFLAAHRRHWEDAEFLFDNCRWPNADHLYGVSAECGLKTIIERFGIPIKPASDYWAHVNKLWPEFRTLVKDRNEMQYIMADDPFSDWLIGDRYTDGGHIDRKMAIRHREAAELVLTKLEGTAADGAP